MREKIHILVVDDEEIMRDSLSEWLREDGYEVVAVEDGPKTIEKVKERHWSILLVDLKLPGMDGIEVMKEARKIQKGVPVIIITAYATVDTAVQAMKEGAYDYIVKPFDPEEMSLTIRKIIDHQNLVKENILLRKELKKTYQFQDLIGKSHRMQEVFELIRTVADSNATVLIQGESGTGKELVARAIHQSSPRREGPFITLSCGALAEGLLESELFGYEKGAFTDAKATRKGRIELAEGGTLFLDEIGDISLKTQVDLLRVLQEREFRRVGGADLIKVDVRIIAATHRDLKKAIAEGKFREDLYYRLNVITVDMPPLREKKEDIPLLVECFLEKFNIEAGRRIGGISEEALEALMNHDWPGNVRELENCIEHAVVIAKENTITVNDLPQTLWRGEERFLSAPLDKSLQEMEKWHIKNVLEENDWNIQRTAKVLAIDRTTLYRKIKAYRLKASDE